MPTIVFQCSHEGKFLTSFGTKGSGPGQFIEPYGIAVDKNGVVCVSDYMETTACNFFRYPLYLARYWCTIKHVATCNF